VVTPAPLYPLRFEPIFKSALWGGRRLAGLFPGAPAEGPVAEAWVLSDQGENVSRVADGPLRGATLRELMGERRGELLGAAAERHDTFPLLLKFIDARESLSVQVHPDDRLARTLAGVPRGKTEAWVVLHAEPGSRIYAGLKEGVGRAEFERAVAAGRTAECLASFEPQVGDGVFLPAGTVHALGAGVTVFEVQQTSDTTYRLYDWDRTDARTGRPRELHVEQALACTDFARGPVGPIRPADDPKSAGYSEELVRCPYFVLRRSSTMTPVYVGARQCRILVGLEGQAVVKHKGQDYALGPNDVLLLPPIQPHETVLLVPDGFITLLDCWPL
jgi:mannose-6-phosphate isomerase